MTSFSVIVDVLVFFVQKLIMDYKTKKGIAIPYIRPSNYSSCILFFKFVLR